MKCFSLIIRPGSVRVICLFPLVFCQGVLLEAQHVDIRDGNLYYADARGNSKQITSSGMDLDPSLSFDGKTVIFVRRTLVPARFEEPTDPQPKQRQIWVAKVGGPSDPEIVLGGPVVLKDFSEYVSFASPKLSPDNRYAYFRIPVGVTESGLVRVDLRTKVTSLVCYGTGYDIVPSGKYAGDLVVQMRKSLGDAVPGGGFSAFFWLLTPEGKELGFVGESDEDAQRFLRSRNRSLGRDPLIR